MARYTPMGFIVKAAPHASVISAALREPRESKHTSTTSVEAKEIAASQQASQPSFREPLIKQVDPIILIDIDAYKYSSTEESWRKKSLVLPTVPMDVDFDPEPQWNTVASIGRNAPFYNYSGSEDTLSMKIDWYSKEDHKADVIYACRWIEALTKADGYTSQPHRVMIVWGKDDKLFYKDTWIVFKASYTMSQFQKHRSMLPQQAYQEVVFKKVLEKNSSTLEVFNMFAGLKV